MCDPLKNISFKEPLFEKRKKKDRPGLPVGWNNHTPPPASASPYLVAASRHSRGSELPTGTMSRFQTWPRLRGSGRSPRRRRSAPLPEHPRAEARPGEGGALACPAQHGRDRGSGARPAARPVRPESARPAGARLARWNRLVAALPGRRTSSSQRPVASPPRGSASLGPSCRSSPLAPASASSLLPGPAPPGQQSSSRSPRAGRTRG